MRLLGRLACAGNKQVKSTCLDVLQTIVDASKSSSEKTKLLPVLERVLLHADEIRMSAASGQPGGHCAAAVAAVRRGLRAAAGGRGLGACAVTAGVKDTRFASAEGTVAHHLFLRRNSSRSACFSSSMR